MNSTNARRESLRAAGLPRGRAGDRPEGRDRAAKARSPTSKYIGPPLGLASSRPLPTPRPPALPPSARGRPFAKTRRAGPHSSAKLAGQGAAGGGRDGGRSAFYGKSMPSSSCTRCHRKNYAGLDWSRGNLRSASRPGDIDDFGQGTVASGERQAAAAPRPRKGAADKLTSHRLDVKMCMPGAREADRHVCGPQLVRARAREEARADRRGRHLRALAA